MPVQDIGGPYQKARMLAIRWVGEKYADQLLEAFQLVRRSFSLFTRPFFPLVMPSYLQGIATPPQIV
jgi:hypothetical protein